MMSSGLPLRRGTRPYHWSSLGSQANFSPAFFMRSTFTLETECQHMYEWRKEEKDET